MAVIKVGGHIRKTVLYAYTLEDVVEMLLKLGEPVRTVCAVAAFTGLSHSELPALKWTDYDGNFVTVNRKLTGNFVRSLGRVVGSHIGVPKTTARQATIPVVPELRTILSKYKENFPPGEQEWIFYGAKAGEPITMHNLVSRDIKPLINDGWHGWHAFRRGL